MTLDGYFEGKSPWQLGFLETVWGDELEAFSLEQGREIGTDIYVFGSADLLASLLSAGLVDGYRVCVAPVVLGGGNPLFKPQDQQVKMRLESARPLKIGGVILTCAVGG